MYHVCVNTAGLHASAAMGLSGRLEFDTAVTTGFVRGHRRAPATTNNRRIHRDTHHRCTRMYKRSNLPPVPRSTAAVLRHKGGTQGKGGGGRPPVALVAPGQRAAEMWAGPEVGAVPAGNARTRARTAPTPMVRWSNGRESPSPSLMSHFRRGGSPATLPNGSAGESLPAKPQAGAQLHWAGGRRRSRKSLGPPAK
jgi:hypothetical protein